MYDEATLGFSGYDFRQDVTPLRGVNIVACTMYCTITDIV